MSHPTAIPMLRHLGSSSCLSAKHIPVGIATPSFASQRASTCLVNLASHNVVRTFGATASPLAMVPGKKKIAGPLKKSSVAVRKTGDRKSGGTILRDVSVPIEKRPAPKIILQNLSAETAGPDNVNRVLRIPDPIMKRMGSQRLPKSLEKDFEFIHGIPALLLRKSSLDIIHHTITEPDRKSNQHRLILTGPPGVGTSSLLLQTVTRCQEMGWIVVYITRPAEWTDAFQPFHPREGTDLFDQPELASRVLQDIKQFSGSALHKTRLSKPRNFGRSHLTKESDLSTLLDVGANDSQHAHAVLDAFFEELSVGNDRPPILFAIDSVNALLSTTAYADLDNKPLPSDRLSLVRPFLHVLLGDTHIPKSAFLGTLNASELIIESPSLNRLLATAPSLNGNPNAPPGATPKPDRLDAKQILSRFPDPSKVVGVYTEKMDEFSGKVTSIPGLRKFEVPLMSKAEVEGMLRYYIDTTVYRNQQLTPDLVNRCYIISAGNPGRLLKMCTSQFGTGPAPSKRKEFEREVQSQS
ncbi:hypothetical protein M427DRAFT_53542 [Gonapodya prolifera JEL478]|uniref:Small ribosomal subunit protein mS29 n=1 Tax=Gonapodya prolifera (strain JEL478) TaxID=1344416 RepID=A0A139APD4_GONPJ|nr:hypothetical protein M427DRAFT_53542 [Gonapodya prolifera JEL478]|eukprot:KXS18588.1 hypothetical protein M427DRAFT_53542 [Gonapodya prolifera JEL478]